MLDTVSRYVYEVYRLKSVSQAAKELFISQPALSAAIRRAEEELGAPIFNRKTLPFSLTPEGRVYIDAVEHMLRIEKQTAEHIQDIRATKKGKLRIGTSTHVSYYLIPAILKRFHHRHPQVEVRIEQTATDGLYRLMEQETVDMVLIPTDAVPEGYVGIPLLEERLVVAMRRDAPELSALDTYAIGYEELIARRYREEQILKDMSLLSGLEFIYSQPNTGIYKKHRLLLSGWDLLPYVMSNTANMVFNYNLMLAGVGAFLTTDAGIATMPPNNDCRYLVLGGAGARQTLFMAYPANAHSVVRDAFIEIATEHMADGAPLSRLRTI